MWGVWRRNAIAATILLCPMTAIAGEPTPGGWSTSIARDPRMLRLESSAGGEARAHGWAGWSTITYALTGTNQTSGWRLRGGAGSGRQRYTSVYVWPNTANGFAGQAIDRQIETRFGEAMVGYQLVSGQAVLKLFAGAATLQRTSRRVTPPLATNPWQQAQEVFDRDLIDLDGDVHAKGAAELWLNIGRHFYLQLDAAATWRPAPYDEACRTTNETCVRQNRDRWLLSMLGRVGVRLGPQVSVGPELAASLDTVDQVHRDAGDNDIEAVSPLARLGLFARYDWGRGEAVVSGGLAGDDLDRVRGYATFNVLYRF